MNVNLALTAKAMDVINRQSKRILSKFFSMFVFDRNARSPVKTIETDVKIPNKIVAIIT